MTLATGRAEIAKAAEEAVCFQVCDIIDVMRGESGSDIRIVNADGGMVNDTYLMQLQSDFLNADILASDMEELSAAGVAYMAGAERGVKRSNRYAPCGSREYHIDKYGGWKKEIALLRP
jgi:glycerol kinase